MASEEFSEGSEQKRSKRAGGRIRFLEKLLLEACVKRCIPGRWSAYKTKGASGLTCSTWRDGRTRRDGTRSSWTLCHSATGSETRYEIMLSELAERMCWWRRTLRGD